MVTALRNPLRSGIWGALAVGFGCVVGLGVMASPAAAHPPLTPHDHDPGKIWFGTENINHNHLWDRDPRSANDRNAGFVYDADWVWDNRTYRAKRDALLVETSELPVFAHGFIDLGMEPRYKFIDGPGASITFDNAKKALIDEAVRIWVQAAVEQSAGRTTPDGTPLVTGIGLVETNGAEFEFRIGFFDNLREQHDVGALWMVVPNQRWGGGGSPTRQELEMTPILAFDDDVKWLFDTTKTPGADEFDFLSIAIHELGHVFGLAHAPGGQPGIGPEGIVMRAGLAFEDATNGKTFRMVDDFSARAAAALYTQPVPIPAPATLALLGLAIPLWFGKRWLTRSGSRKPI